MADQDDATQSRAGRWPLLASAVLFAVFVASLLAGRLGGAPILGDVAEAVLLFAAIVAFVIAILAREAAASRQ